MSNNSSLLALLLLAELAIALTIALITRKQFIFGQIEVSLLRFARANAALLFLAVAYAGFRNL